MIRCCESRICKNLDLRSVYESFMPLRQLQHIFQKVTHGCAEKTPPIHYVSMPKRLFRAIAPRHAFGLW